MASRASPERSIRVFVSSTFRDMRDDRDYLVKFTFPELRKICDARGVIWSEVDLRWGIPDEKSAEAKVLPVCFAEIERCRPWFIGLLAGRYGWIPEPIPASITDAYPWIDSHTGASVTELEMLHAVLRQPAADSHAFFYFRDPASVDRLPAGAHREDFIETDEARRSQLERLKDRIRHASRSGGCRLRENYRDSEELGRWIVADFRRHIDMRFGEGADDSRLAREAAMHESFARSRRSVYVGRPVWFDVLHAHATTDHGGRGLAVIGESGAGKSALLANWTSRLADDRFVVLVHYVGASPASADATATVRRLIEALNHRLGLEAPLPEVPTDLTVTLANALLMASAACARPVESSRDTSWWRRLMSRIAEQEPGPRRGHLSSCSTTRTNWRMPRARMALRGCRL